MEYLKLDLLNEAVKHNLTFGKMIDAMSKEVAEFCNNFSDSPTKISQWGHHDFCSFDGGKLIFDVNRPFDHICEICGRNNQSKLLDGVWVYNYRNLAVLTIWKSAFLYRYTKDKKYLDNIYQVLGFYKDNYTSFALHDKEGHIFTDVASMKWGAGRIMPQGLNEAIITIRIINALELVKDDLDKNFLAELKVDFFDNIAQVLMPQVDKIHNIPCWLNSAIGLIGFFYNDQKYLDFVFKGKYNIYNQIASGVTADGFWFEGSIHYNFFTLEGIINLWLFANLYNYQLDQKANQTIFNMLVSAYNYAFDNNVLPNPNDGWPNINLKTYSYIYAIGAKVFGVDSQIGNLLALIETSKIQRAELPLSKPYYYQNQYSLERLILVPNLDVANVVPFERRSINFTESQFAILRNKKVNVFLKYGHNGPSHAHPDKMNIEVMMNNQMISRDLSNAGYGNKYCDQWHRVTASHNTVVVNGLNQQSMDRGKTIFFDNDKMSFTAKNVYGISNLNIDKMQETMNYDEIEKYIKANFKLSVADAKKLSSKNLLSTNTNQANSLDVDFTRTISLLENGYDDQFVVNSKTYVTIDLFMHVEGELLTQLDSKPDTLGYQTDGYQHITNVHRIAANSTKYVLKWQVKDQILTFTTNLKNRVLFLADTYDNPINKSRKTLIIRYHGKRTKFSQTWKVEE